MVSTFPRRPLTLAAVVATATAVTIVSLAAAGDAAAAPTPAAPGTAGLATAGILALPHTAVRTCATAAVGYAACQAQVVTDLGRAPLATTSYQSGYAPAQLRAAYGLGAGSSLTVAIVDAYANPNAASDLAAYRAQFGLGTANLTQYNQSGGTTLPKGDVGWGQEEMLDLEMVSAICPACSIIYVGGNSASFDDLSAAVDTAVAKGAKVVSNSYGGAEDPSETSTATHYDHPGVAITASSGDSGYGASSPAAFNTVTAVGGTKLTLNSDNTRKSESVWGNGSRSTLLGGAGSGCSKYIAKPSWQHDKGCSKRTIADVSAVADPNTGVAVYDSYGSKNNKNWYVFGGTSVAAPIIGGVYALSGNTSGVPASLAYSAPAGSLYDVVGGSNGTCTSAYLCKGKAGYDGPSGLGTPNGTGAF